MKKYILTSFLSLTAFLFVFTSCNKNDDTPAVKTKTELISQGSWRFSSATVSGSDVSAFLQACQKDNILTFNANLSGNVDEGSTKCNGADPQNVPFTWFFSSGETILNISTALFSGGSSVFTLVSLSATQLVLSQQITVGGTPQTAVVTFVH